MRTHSAALERSTRILRGAELENRAPAPSIDGPRAIGCLLVALDFTLLHANSAAVRILSFPDPPRAAAAFPVLAQRRLRSIFNIDTVEPFNSLLAPADFVSGRRQYVCRPFLLDGTASPPLLTVLMERPVRTPGLSEVGRRFRLSPRERETVQYLVHGLTTKQMARRMSVSPNTVKQFIRLAMTKMGVTTRSGIIGKLIAD